MKLNLTNDQVVMIIAALNYYAQNEAGQTQMPDLCEPKDYEEFDLALELRRRLDKSILLSAQWTTNEHGETVRRT